MTQARKLRTNEAEIARNWGVGAEADKKNRRVMTNVDDSAGQGGCQGIKGMSTHFGKAQEEQGKKGN